MTLLDQTQTPHTPSDPSDAVDPPAAPPATPPAARPPAPPARGQLPPPPSGQPSRSPRGRLLGAAAVGALVGAVVAGGIVVLTRDDAADTAPSTTAPASAAPANAAASDGNDIAALVDAAEPAIVAIHDEMAQTDLFGRQVEGQAAGTGFVLSSDGYVVTNDHVIHGASDITVDFSDGSQAAANVIAADPNADLAVLKVDKKGLTALPLGSSNGLEIGEQVVAIGNALDLSGAPTVTTGIVSATGRSLDEPNGTHLTNLLQTDTAINPGNSGGPLLDMGGHVVGINTAIAGEAQNIGFAIAIDPAKALIDQLEHGQVPAHALLGVSGQLDPDGVRIANVSAGSSADDAGLRTGDVITAIDDQSVSTPDELATAIADHEPGDHVTVHYRRGDADRTVDVTLGTRPAGD